VFGNFDDTKDTRERDKNFTISGFT